MIEYSIMSDVRVRFAPSPTGPLHIGGVRTALYNYLFAKHAGGAFILRVEDTDQNRYVAGAEDYIVEALDWFGLTPDEGPGFGGDYGPYRQSERKDFYAKYAIQMVEQGNAYYAWDTPADLDSMRTQDSNAKYDAKTRVKMKNGLTLSADEVKLKLESGVKYVIRLKMPENEDVMITDLVRGEVTFNTQDLDDKVILKGDGMPTYHLANIVDDHLMKISHVIRGEEWLSSTAHHVLMYRFMGWEAPQFSHLPLILKPTGKGKLSKRDGAKFGLPVFPLEWNPGNDEELYSGFREFGFLPDAVINFLAFLGWNPGTEQEIFSLDELVNSFSIKRIVKSGARFDYDKAKWYNQQYIIKTANEVLAAMIRSEVSTIYSDEYLAKACGLMKERVETVGDIPTVGNFLFGSPTEYDAKMILKKYKEVNDSHFVALTGALENLENFSAESTENTIKGYIEANGLSFGAIMPVLRLATSGTMKGPDLFEMMELLGHDEVLVRMRDGLKEIKKIKSEVQS